MVASCASSGLPVVQRVLGHRSLRTTLETYAHACDTHAAEAMAHRFGR
jgi:integrase